MKIFVFLIMLCVILPPCMATENNECEIHSETVNTISVKEFYFGRQLAVVNIAEGPTVSVWGIDTEQAGVSDGLQTKYLISVGYGDIAEEPRVFRILSRQNVALQTNTADSLVFSEGLLKVSLLNKKSGQLCKPIEFAVPSA